MTILTNPPGAIKSVEEIRLLLNKRRKLTAKLYAAPWADGIPIETISFTKHSFVMNKRKVCQVRGSTRDPYNGTLAYDYILFKGEPPRLVCAMRNWSFDSQNAFVFTNYWMAHAHAVRCGAIK